MDKKFITEVMNDRITKLYKDTTVDNLVENTVRADEIRNLANLLGGLDVELD